MSKEIYNDHSFFLAEAFDKEHLYQGYYATIKERTKNTELKEQYSQIHQLYTLIIQRIRLYLPPSLKKKTPLRKN